MNLPNKNSILSNILLPSDKKYDLDLKSQICRICFYTGSREPQSNHNSTFRKNLDNPYIALQRYNFDVYVHVDIDIVDFRLTDICDRLNEILLLQRITNVGEFTLDYASPIQSTPDGFLGFKLVYKTISLQESTVREWK